MSEYDPQVNRSTDNGYEWLDDDGYSISVRDGDGKVMYVDYNEGKFTLDYRNWKTDYDLCRMDYEDLLRDINNLLNSTIVFIVVRSNGEVLSLWTASDSECSRDELISAVRRLQSEHQTIGVEIRVPLFIDEGELVLVDTRDGSYLQRVKE
ncbi:MAG: hypothetical protein IKH76_07605 [Clostridiales bacterium]|nr:hypothetical protein [Clostridiales bacterium]